MTKDDDDDDDGDDDSDKLNETTPGVDPERLKAFNVRIPATFLIVQISSQMLKLINSPPPMIYLLLG